MVDTLQGFSKVPILLDNTFVRANNGYLKKNGIYFKLASNGYLNFYGSLSEFWNKTNEISNTNYPLIPLNDLNLCLQTFEDFFNIRLNDVDLRRLDVAVDLEYSIFFDLNKLDIIDKNYEVKTFSKIDSSIMFSQKKDNNIRLLFYQNAAKNRPPGLRFETRYLKKSVPFIYGSDIKPEKIKNYIVPFMELNLNKIIYKNEIFDLNQDIKKITYGEIRNSIYKHGLLNLDNKSFYQFIEHVKNLGLDRHNVKRIIDERNQVLINSNKALIDDPIKLIINNLNLIKNGF
jgi:hypothetical protein